MKKICFHTGASVLITDAEASINKLSEAVETFIEQKDNVQIIWCADENVDKALDGPLGADDLKECYYKLVDRLRNEANGEYIPEPTDMELADIADECDAYYGDNGYLMGLFINAGKPVMKMDL